MSRWTCYFLYLMTRKKYGKSLNLEAGAKMLNPYLLHSHYWKYMFMLNPWQACSLDYFFISQLYIIDCGITMSHCNMYVGALFPTCSIYKHFCSGVEFWPFVALTSMVWPKFCYSKLEHRGL